MILSFSGSEIRNSTEEELRESMRQQIEEQTASQQRESATMRDDCNHEDSACWLCDVDVFEKDRKESETRRRYR